MWALRITEFPSLRSRIRPHRLSCGSSSLWTRIGRMTLVPFPTLGLGPKNPCDDDPSIAIVCSRRWCELLGKQQNPWTLLCFGRVPVHLKVVRVKGPLSLVLLLDGQWVAASRRASAHLWLLQLLYERVLFIIITHQWRTWSVRRQHRHRRVDRTWWRNRNFLHVLAQVCRRPCCWPSRSLACGFPTSYLWDRIPSSTRSEVPSQKLVIVAPDLKLAGNRLRPKIYQILR